MKATDLKVVWYAKVTIVDKENDNGVITYGIQRGTLRTRVRQEQLRKPVRAQQLAEDRKRLLACQTQNYNIKKCIVHSGYRDIWLKWPLRVSKVFFLETAKGCFRT